MKMMSRKKVSVSKSLEERSQRMTKKKMKRTGMMRVSQTPINSDYLFPPNVIPFNF